MRCAGQQDGPTSADAKTRSDRPGNRIAASLLGRRPLPVERQQAATAVDAHAVWNANTSIHSHFGNDVSRFVQDTNTQWTSQPSVRHHFDDIAAYRRLYPGYFGQGIANPAQWIRSNITGVTFWNRRNLSIHNDLVGPLERVETRLRTAIAFEEATGVSLVGEGERDPVHNGGFVPRNIRGGGTPSQHAFGRP